MNFKVQQGKARPEDPVSPQGVPAKVDKANGLVQNKIDQGSTDVLVNDGRYTKLIQNRRKPGPNGR